MRNDGVLFQDEKDHGVSYRVNKYAQIERHIGLEQLGEQRIDEQEPERRAHQTMEYPPNCEIRGVNVLFDRVKLLFIDTAIAQIISYYSQNLHYVPFRLLISKRFRQKIVSFYIFII